MFECLFFAVSFLRRFLFRRALVLVDWLLSTPAAALARSLRTQGARFPVALVCIRDYRPRFSMARLALRKSETERGQNEMGQRRFYNLKAEGRASANAKHKEAVRGSNGRLRKINGPGGSICRH